MKWIELQYEGHPPAPWGWRHKVAEYRLTANGDKEWIDGIRVDENTDPTVMALIADAPLLLAEVKRLREVLVNTYWMTGGVETVDMSKTTKDILNYLSAHVHIDEDIEVKE